SRQRRSRRQGAPRPAWRERSCPTRSGPRSRSRPYGRLHRSKGLASAGDSVSVRGKLAVTEVLESSDDRRGRDPARINLGDAALVLRRRLAGLAPPSPRAIRKGEQPPVDESDGRGRRPVIARRAPTNGASREERTERRAESEARSRGALQLRAFGERDPSLSHRPFEKDKRHEDDDDRDDDLESTDHERPGPFELAQQRKVIARTRLAGRRAEEAPSSKERLEDRVHERREVAKGQEQREDEVVERGRESFPQITEQLIDGRRGQRGDERRDPQREDDRIRGREPGRPRRPRREGELLGRTRDRERDGRSCGKDERERHEWRAVNRHGRDRDKGQSQ